MERKHKATEHTAEHTRLQRGEDLAFARAQALRSLIFTMPARSLADAVVHLGFALDVVDSVEGNELGGHEMAEHLVRLRRMLTSAFPVTAAAANVDPSEMHDEHDWLSARHAFEFGAVEGVS